jgi:hypothetical protein
MEKQVPSSKFVSLKTSSTVGLKIRANTKGSIKFASPATIRRRILMVFCGLLLMLMIFKVNVMHTWCQEMGDGLSFP